MTVIQRNFHIFTGLGDSVIWRSRFRSIEIVFQLLYSDHYIGKKSFYKREYLLDCSVSVSAGILHIITPPHYIQSNFNQSETFGLNWSIPEYYGLIELNWIELNWIVIRLNCSEHCSLSVSKHRFPPGVKVLHNIQVFVSGSFPYRWVLVQVFEHWSIKCYGWCSNLPR